jgi:hypothetical protein
MHRYRRDEAGPINHPLGRKRYSRDPHHRQQPGPPGTNPTRNGGSHAQDFHPFRSGVRLSDDGHRDGRDDRRDLGHRHGTGDPLKAVPYLTPFLSSYLLLVIPGVLTILLAVLLRTSET